MLRSREFWIPVIIGIAITAFAVLWVIMMAMAGGAHGKQDPGMPSLAGLLFPFATLFERATSVAGFALAAIFFLFQFPAYGVAVGYGNFKGKFIPSLLAVFGLHLVVYRIPTYL